MAQKTIFNAFAPSAVRLAGVLFLRIDDEIANKEQG